MVARVVVLEMLFTRWRFKGGRANGSGRTETGRQKRVHLSLHRRQADPLGGTWAIIEVGDHENRNHRPPVATFFLFLFFKSHFLPSIAA